MPARVDFAAISLTTKLAALFGLLAVETTVVVQKAGQTGLKLLVAIGLL